MKATQRIGARVSGLTMNGTIKAKNDYGMCLVKWDSPGFSEWVCHTDLKPERKEWNES
jgi:hypothetical protein